MSDPSPVWTLHLLVRVNWIKNCPSVQGVNKSEFCKINMETLTNKQVFFKSTPLTLRSFGPVCVGVRMAKLCLWASLHGKTRFSGRFVWHFAGFNVRVVVWSLKFFNQPHLILSLTASSEGKQENGNLLLLGGFITSNNQRWRSVSVCNRS